MFSLFCFCFIVIAGERFVPETYENGYKITMRLTINDVDAQDFGSYRCVAKNSLGDTDGAIKLYRKYMSIATTIITIIRLHIHIYDFMFMVIYHMLVFENSCECVDL